MVRLMLPLLAALLLVAPGWAQDATALRVVVLDGTNAPVAGLALLLRCASDDAAQLTTDAAGSATATQLAGSACTIVTARRSDGTSLGIDGTMADGSLRLGLVPGRERTVLLRLDGATLTVDGETLFAGPELPPTVATIEAGAQRPHGGPGAAPAAAPPLAAANSATGAAPLAGPAAPVAAGEAARWPLAVVLALIVAVVAALVALRARALARRGRGRGV